MTKRLYRVTLNPENDCKVDQSAPRWLCQIALGLVSRSSCQIMTWQIWMEGSGNPQHRPLRTIWGAQFGETTESSQRLFKSGAWSNQTMLSRFEPWSEYVRIIAKDFRRLGQHVHLSIPSRCIRCTQKKPTKKPLCNDAPSHSLHDLSLAARVKIDV